MAALRERDVRVITSNENRAFLREVARRKRKGLKPLHYRNAPGKSIKKFEIVATSAEEAASGLFQPVGDLLAFIPEQVEDHLWSRISTMDAEQNREVWTNPYWGIRRAMKKMGMGIPWEKIKQSRDLSIHFPASLLEQALEQHRIVHAEVKVVKDSTGELKTIQIPESVQRYNPYREFIERVWLPRWLYNVNGVREGYFPNKRRAYAVASAFGIEVDTSKKAADWFRTMTPNVQAEAERTLIVPEDAFQDLKQAIQSTIEQSWSRHKVFEPDWSVLFEQLRGMYGIKSQAVVNRLRVELDPLIQSLKSKPAPFEENRSRANRRASVL
jgi:hypothetical protein